MACMSQMSRLTGFLSRRPDAAGRGGNGRRLVFFATCNPTWRAVGVSFPAARICLIRLPRKAGARLNLAPPFGRAATRACDGTLGNMLIRVKKRMLARHLQRDVGWSKARIQALIPQRVTSRVLPKGDPSSVQSRAGFAGVHGFFLPCSLRRVSGALASPYGDMSYKGD